MDPPLPVPKPRARYMRDSVSSSAILETDVTSENQQQVLSNGVHPNTGDDVVFPTLSGVTDLIALNIPSLAGLALAIGGSTPSAPPAAAPPTVESLANNIAANVPSLARAASVVAKPAKDTLTPDPIDTPEPAAETSTANDGAASLDSIFSSLANVPGLSGIVASAATDPAVSSTTPSAPPPTSTKTGASSTGPDIGALSQLVMSTLEQNSGITLPPLEGATEPSEDGRTAKENPYVTLLACWASQEEDSSNEEEDTGVSPAPAGGNGPMGTEPAANLSTSTNNLPVTPSGRLVPKRPAPPRPDVSSQSVTPKQKQKTPRAATIRVSRKKAVSGPVSPQSAVVRSSWLDVWKGFKHNVMWATLDGQLMSLWKKRTDRFSELLFHVSSITNVKKQDKGRFSVYFRKKHYDFMAHNDEVQEGWVTSLLASRGQPSPSPPDHHGPISMKDTRNRGYAALWGHDLWVYSNREGFTLGIASFSVPLNVASVKPTGKHSFTLITPYKTFNMSVDSSKELPVWLDNLSASIRSALSCSQVSLRLWENPDNKVCGDCGAANPEWASVNLLLVICQACAGQHRALGSNLSKVRSLKMDSKVWTEPLLQLFVAHGNRLANEVWAAAVPGGELLRPEASDEERSKFIQDKYKRGRYRRVHALVSAQTLMHQRLCQVACSDDVQETMSLICSGAKVCQSDPQSPSPILLAERAGQALQTELLRLNEYTDIPPYLPQTVILHDSASSGEEEEELHGKLEDDRFLFSLENDSAACDVLDLREVLSVFVNDGWDHQFTMVTLNDQLICAADDQEALQTHLVHILKVILPRGVSYAEVGGASAVSKVCVVAMGGGWSDAWLLLWEDGVSVHPVHRHTQTPLTLELSMLTHHEMDSSKNIITLGNADRSVSLRFEEPGSCEIWFKQLQRALANERRALAAKPRLPPPPPANHSPARQSLYPVIRGTVPAAVERCISHITTYGLKVEGVYRRCGLATKVALLVDALMTSPGSAPLESHEQGVLDAGSALKQYVRQQPSLVPETQRPQWQQAAVISDERSRFAAYRQLLRQLPDDNRATLNALFGHFYMVQVFSQVNKMSAHNLAVVLVPTLFESMNPDLLRLTREFIIHHTLLFLTPEAEKKKEEEEEQITVF